MITVWKDGSWKEWREGDAYYAANDPDWLVNIPTEDDEPKAGWREYGIVLLIVTGIVIALLYALQWLGMAPL